MGRPLSDGQCRIHIEAARAKPRGRGLSSTVAVSTPKRSVVSVCIDSGLVVSVIE